MAVGGRNTDKCWRLCSWGEFPLLLASAARGNAWGRDPNKQYQMQGRELLLNCRAIRKEKFTSAVLTVTRGENLKRVECCRKIRHRA